MKIVFLDQGNFQCAYEQFDYSLLKSCGEYISYDETPEHLIVERCQNADIVIVLKTKLPAHIIKEFTKTKLICKMGTGYDNIDIMVAKNKNILVTNVPGYATSMVAQSTITLLLALAGNIFSYDRAVKKNQWMNAQFSWPIMEVQYQVLGIIGYGHIGKRVAKLAHALGMKVLVNTKFSDTNDNVDFVDLATIYRESDYLSLHASLNQQTHEMINATTFQQMKPTSYLINTSRAGLVNKKDLYLALKNKQIAGAAFDGFWQEPPQVNDMLFDLDNIIITPHVAWGSMQTKQFLLNTIAERIRDFMDCKKIYTVA